MIYRITLLAVCSALCVGAVQAQDDTGTNDQADQAEAREDAYRRSMELEGSRDQQTFSNTTYSAKTRQEKIDKLPKESRDNIREQLTDVIIENSQWEPFDALREYPYEPSITAQNDPGLRDREMEAWAEQMDKYHEREANAYGASRPSMPASDSRQTGGSPAASDQQENELGEGEGQQQDKNQGGEQQGEGQESEGQEGESQNEGGDQGSQGSSASSSSAYNPYQPQSSDDDDEISTAGVSESALDFLKAQQGQNSASTGQVASSQEAMAQMEAPSQADSGKPNEAENQQATSQQVSPESQQSAESVLIIPGTIAIEDLDKLEGINTPADDLEN